MAKKKILFIVSNLETGGVSKSITSLMNVIDRQRYDVSLMIVAPTGELMKLLPTDLRIITNPTWSDVTGRFNGVRNLVKRRRVDLAVMSCVRMALSKVSKSLAGRLMARMMPAIDEEFDTVVDFNGQQQLYYMVNKVKARKKVTFFHSDYAKWPYYYSADKKYFPRVDAIFTVSEQCVDSLRRYFPEQSHKVGLMENISVPAIIHRLADRPAEGMDSSTPALLSIGHLTELKGTSNAIKAARILKDRGVSFKWYFLGENREGDTYIKMIEDLGLKDNIVLLGIKANPYPYMKTATIVVHPSTYEGRSIALDEVKILAKPTVVTNFTTVGDQFTDGINANIVDMTPEAIADGICDLLHDKVKCERYSSYLASHTRDNSSEIEKLYQIFDN